MSGRDEILPPAHLVDLVIERLPDEVMVYDNRTHQAHCLNRSAALVWARCDGRTTVGEMAGLLAAEGLPNDEAIVEFAVAELAKLRLVDAPVRRARVPEYSRRKMLKRAGLVGAVALALPFIQSIVAPSVAMASSGCTGPGSVGSGGTCCADSDCCSGTCVGEGVGCPSTNAGACL